MEDGNARTSALVRQLFESGMSTYGVLDGARNPRIHRLVGASGKMYRPLYDGELSPGMRQVFAVSIDELVGSCAITSYLTLLASRYRSNVRAMLMF